MFRPFTNLSKAILLSGMLIVAPHSLAGKDDFDLPIKVDSKSQFVDGKSKTSIFRDDVHITQGSLTILADEVEVIASLGEGKEVFIARGNPASYSQKMDDGSDIRAMAEEIKYEVNIRTLTLDGNAELQQNSSMVKGESIVFNMELEQLVAQGTDDTEGRVTTIFRPESIRKDKDDQDDDNKEDQP